MNDGAQAALLAMMLLLPLSALLARRVPLTTALRMALAWVAIFVVAVVLVSQRDRVSQASKALFGGDQTVAGSIVRLHKAPDGHFYADVSLNGVSRRMLIDSGATTTALSAETARAAGIDTANSTFPRMIETANGEIVALPATVTRLSIGGIEARDLPVIVSEAFGKMDVIGMNFLSRLRSWRVEGDTLILEPDTQL